VDRFSRVTVVEVWEKIGNIEGRECPPLEARRQVKIVTEDTSMYITVICKV
jgi:hypothetical protein